MEKQKRWQGYLILAVLLLTLYNILPTLFYYAQPLRTPIDAARAETITYAIADRVNGLEGDGKAWLDAFCRLLGIKGQEVTLDAYDPRFFHVTFVQQSDAELFRRLLPRAGALIPFVPAQLELLPTPIKAQTITVMRQVGVHIDSRDLQGLFHFTEKYDKTGAIAPFYRDIVYDRAAAIALALGGPSNAAIQIAAAVSSPNDPSYDEAIIAIARELSTFAQVVGRDSALFARYLSSLVQGVSNTTEQLAQQFFVRLEALKVRLAEKKELMIAERSEQEKKAVPLSSLQEQALSFLEANYAALDSSSALIRQYIALFKKSPKPLTPSAIATMLQASHSEDAKQRLSLEGYNPFASALVIDWNNDLVYLQFYDDVQKIRLGSEGQELAVYGREKINQLIFNDIARTSRLADEQLRPYEQTFASHLSHLTDAASFLALDLGFVARKQAQYLVNQLHWTSSHPDLNPQAYPLYLYEQWKQQPAEEQKLGLVVYIPGIDSKEAPSGLRTGSLYVIAHGLEALLRKAEQSPDSPSSKQLIEGFKSLSTNLQQYGFLGYPGSSFGIDPTYAKDYIFEWNDYYSHLLKATREEFFVHGSKRWALLDFSDVEQRILVRNRIADKIQEDLLKWKEEYTAAQVSLDATSKYLVPPPTKNPYWSNFKTSFIKYFTGDERKILKWGLDLSGGKTVRIGLRDHNNRVVTNPDELRQAENELYKRINTMGVSERTIRIENNNLVLEFPGSQGMSAQDLVKASAMSFHIVNEKFTPNNDSLREAVNQFLQELWNEALVTNRKDIASINEIAWEHLGSFTAASEGVQPRSSSAQLLYDNGLRLANSKVDNADQSFNDAISTIGMMSGEEFTQWDGQTHPLMILFYNYALEGSSLNNIQAGYDPSEGNILTFGVKRSYDNREGSPRDDFYSWTSQYAEDVIAGTPKEAYSHGRGWRMAVVLNGSIISKPVLRAALRDGATISGHFSQREVSQLAADLKAGSLSFTPQILSEQNVSPELGKEERSRGIAAAIVAIVLVAAAMVGYYHFAGLVALCAVLFNILVMWSVLQNIDAALTLPGIAGIVLTIGMAVDANVLVFERFREEYKLSGRLGSALQSAYRKAFSAIVDSNLTTIIAALVLIQFDSGPIKGFAVTLIIGILSSMFTALFMTRYFFAGWLQRAKHRTLSMAQFFGQTSFDFLAQTKRAITLSCIVLLLGAFFFVSQYNAMFGMDFTGGYALTVELQQQPNNRTESYRLQALGALLSHGATTNDVQVRELSRPTQLRLQFAMGMEEKSHPFYGLPDVYTEGDFPYSYQSNPRIAWVVTALEASGLAIEPAQLATLETNWTVVSGQFSDAMRNNALIGLAIALICILLYITLRFEFNFAVAAVIALAHDLLITLGVIAVCHRLGMPVQIDMQVVGAIMTIIGYSLNDTIIVFDRIREDRHVLRKLSFREVINHAINVTLSRTVMTSGTTLLVLLALLLLGGSLLFGFTLVMTLGVFIGTLSSLFIAGPVLLFLHEREQRRALALKDARR